MNRQQKQTYWLAHLRTWRESGLSQVDYCALHDLPLSSFYYWLQRERKSSVSQPPALTLVPVRVAPAAPSQQVSVVLRGPGAWSLEVPAGMPASWLAEVLRGLV